MFLIPGTHSEYPEPTAVPGLRPDELKTVVDNPSIDVRKVVEYYNASLDHYFITWVTDEITKLDAGTEIKGWKRTGQEFNTYVVPQTGTSAVCRATWNPVRSD